MHRYGNSARLIAAVVGMALLTGVTVAAASGMAWGEPADGMRLGIEIGPRLTLHIVIENKGKVERNIALGSSTAKGAVYDFEFRIKTPDGKESMLFNMNGPAGIWSGAQPVIAHIAPGKTWEVSLPMDKFTSMEGGRERKLPDLLQAGYSVHVIVDTTPAARAERTRTEWTGRLTSGELRR